MGRLGAGDAGRAGCPRHDQPGGACGVGPEPVAGEAAGIARSARGPVPPAPRLPREPTTGAPRLPRRGHRDGERGGRSRVGPFRGPGWRRLDTIPGINKRTAEVLIAEIGVDMSRFPSEHHLASWAGLCPGNNESAGKHKAGTTRKGDRWLRLALVEAALARDPDQGQRAGRALSARHAPPRAQEGGRRGRTCDAPGRLSCPGRRARPIGIPAPDYYDRRRARHATRRAVEFLERQGLPRHTRTRGLSAETIHRGFSEQASRTRPEGGGSNPHASSE